MPNNQCSLENIDKQEKQKILAFCDNLLRNYNDMKYQK